MNKLILQPSSTAHWQNLLIEAQEASALNLSEDHESYLVFTLMRFTNNASIAKSILALEYLNALLEQSSKRSEQLRDVGDKCLLFAGLFPERAVRKRVSISYYVHLGSSAYHCCAERHQRSESSLFESLAQEFVLLMDVLQAIRELNQDAPPSLSAIHATELWQDTGSQQALQTLRHYTKATPVYQPTNKDPNIH